MCVCSAWRRGARVSECAGLGARQNGCEGSGCSHAHRQMEKARGRNERRRKGEREKERKSERAKERKRERENGRTGERERARKGMAVAVRHRSRHRHWYAQRYARRESTCVIKEMHKHWGLGVGGWGCVYVSSYVLMVPMILLRCSLSRAARSRPTQGSDASTSEAYASARAWWARGSACGVAVAVNIERKPPYHQHAWCADR